MSCEGNQKPEPGLRQRFGFLWESACRRRFWLFACKHAPTMSRSQGLVFCRSGGSTAMVVAGWRGFSRSDDRSHGAETLPVGVCLQTMVRLEMPHRVQARSHRCVSGKCFVGAVVPPRMSAALRLSRSNDRSHRGWRWCHRNRIFASLRPCYARFVPQAGLLQ